ncbi:type VI immunity family protein [Corallococcus sp. CA053C]|uniref:type VI immunity family protein n=1 Tax=Corallococcus sp. CA053C TaxID=2316732 RepID=UPI00131536CE|nr:type VI immunity family protein [Corallococcus sp. CA053C]
MKEGLSICFYMHHSHRDVAPAIEQTLDLYLQTIGPKALTRTPTDDGYWQDLDDSAMKHIREELLERRAPLIDLRDSSGSLEAYQFHYQGVALDAPYDLHTPRKRHASAVSFWFPVSFLQSHGIGPFRDLALALAKLLPFNSGHAGPSFHAWAMEPLTQQMFQLGLRYPGMDIPDEHNNAYTVGDQLDGIHWMNFIGQPVLGAVGGTEALRARLTHPGTSVESLGGDRALVTLGAEPDAGDTDEGRVLPAYRELARVLEPWLTSREAARPYRENEALLRWERRFLE